MFLYCNSCYIWWWLTIQLLILRVSVVWNDSFQWTIVVLYYNSCYILKVICLTKVAVNNYHGWFTSISHQIMKHWLTLSTNRGSETVCPQSSDQLHDLWNHFCARNQRAISCSWRCMAAVVSYGKLLVMPGVVISNRGLVSLFLSNGYPLVQGCANVS